LGYAPKVTFEEGISRTTQWYKQAHNAGLFDEQQEDEVITSEITIGENVFQVDSQDFHDPLDRQSFQGKLNRDQSDLELSSFVQKASKQYKVRTQRILGQEM
jgi:hypothetical protein